MVPFVICTGQLSDRLVKLTLRSRFLPPSSFPDLDFSISCSERSALWPDDQRRGADGTVCHLTSEGLCNLLQRAGVHPKVMDIYKCRTQLAHKRRGIPQTDLLSNTNQCGAAAEAETQWDITEKVRVLFQQEPWIPTYEKKRLNGTPPPIAQNWYAWCPVIQFHHHSFSNYAINVTRTSRCPLC